MAFMLSKSQVDRLGDRLRTGPHKDSDLALLDEFRRSFDDAYQIVVRRLRELGFEPTGRPAKSTTSIVEKLLRESIRLSQMQDIAGCRIVVPTIVEQEELLEILRSEYSNVVIVDRRENPSHGYRAIHVIPQIDGTPVEIQLRTSLQHHWAERSEKLSDLRDANIKYGSGPRAWQLLLIALSNVSWRVEKARWALSNVDAKAGEAKALEAEVQWLDGEVSKVLEFSRSLSDLDEQGKWSAIEQKLLTSLEGKTEADS